MGKPPIVVRGGKTWIEVVPPACFDIVFHDTPDACAEQKCPGCAVHAARPPAYCEAISAVGDGLRKMNLEVTHSVSRIPMGITRELNQLPVAGVDLCVMTVDRGDPTVFRAGSE